VADYKFVQIFPEVLVMFLRFVPGFLVVLMCVPAIAQSRATAEATINGKRVGIHYGRPALQGRDMLSQARPGTVWRLGMNEATEIESLGTLMIAGKELAAGRYSLWAKMTAPNAWVLAFHPQTGIWGQPELTSGFIAEMPLAVEKISPPVERVTIELADRSGQAALTIQWGDTRLSGRFEVR
jgi:hypothetical protein